MQNPSRLLKIILVNLLVIILLFAICEFGVRYFASPNNAFEERIFYMVNYVPSAYAKFHMKANQKICTHINGKINYDSVKYRINSLGYRGSEFPVQKDSDEIRIAIIGGSHVFDQNCFDFKGCPGFPELMQEELRRKGFKVTVINAGVPGAGTREHIMRAHLDISRFSPDYVVINSIWNDFKWMTRFTGQTQTLTESMKAVEKNPLAERVNIVDHLFGWSVIYRKFHDYYWSRKLGITKEKGTVIEEIINKEPIKKFEPTDKNFEEGYNQYRRNLILLIDIIRQFNSIPVLAVEESIITAGNTQAEKKVINYERTRFVNHDELVSAYSRCGKIIDELGASSGLKVIDVGSELKSLKYFSDHVHMTPEGSRKVAKLYADFFVQVLKDKQ